jgi:toxin-antitoxin system PIN domain toxin
MLMPDVNVLVYAHREEDPRHDGYAAWLSTIAEGPEPFALSVLVAVGFVRIVTARTVIGATPVPLALAYVEELMARPNCRTVIPGPDHFVDVARLCRAVGASGKLVADAQHAALAISEGCTWVSSDGDFARFAPHGLRWQHLVFD